MRESLAREVRLDGARGRAHAKEFDLLAYLIRTRRVFCRDELLEARLGSQLPGRDPDGRGPLRAAAQEDRGDPSRAKPSEASGTRRGLTSAIRPRAAQAPSATAVLVDAVAEGRRRGRPLRGTAARRSPTERQADTVATSPPCPGHQLRAGPRAPLRALRHRTASPAHGDGQRLRPAVAATPRRARRPALRGAATDGDQLEPHRVRARTTDPVGGGWRAVVVSLVLVGPRRARGCLTVFARCGSG